MTNPSVNDESSLEPDDLKLCQQSVGYQFANTELLEAALKHASGVSHRLASNERMEFLGDAILGLVVCEQLYLEYPDFLEGEMTKVKSVVVSRDTCARITESIGLSCFSAREWQAIPRFRVPCWRLCLNRSLPRSI